MQQYIGTKIINARPALRSEVDSLLGKETSNNDEGYLVEYLDGGTPNTTEFDNYISWSPRDVFEKAYKGSGKLTFGDAIAYMKLGHKVARKGWNGKGMFCIYVPGTKDVTFHENSPYAKAVGTEPGQEILPHIDMWTINADGRRAMLPGWLASQSDMLAEDWEIIK
jgi:hypothetical protein